MSDSIWSRWGFTSSPYSTAPLRPAADGADLIVGRDEEIAALQTLLTSSQTIATLEGDNGVGKTSLVQVAGYALEQRSRQDGADQIFIPLSKPLQLGSAELADFIEATYRDIGRALLTRKDVLRRAGIAEHLIRHVRQWLDGGGRADVTFKLPLVNVRKNRDNEMAVEVRLSSLLDDWLGRCFPDQEAGGVICIIDNLDENLLASGLARAAIEQLRDDLLSKPGLRWVLCGTPGVIHEIAASPRLYGYISEPIELGPVDDRLAPDLMERRLAYYGATSAYVPVEASGFAYLYAVTRNHLRDALKLCDGFALFLARHKHAPSATDEKLELLKTWLTDRADRDRARLPPVSDRAWQLFADVVGSEGSAGSHEHNVLGFLDAKALHSEVRVLERAGLVVVSGRSDACESYQFEVTLRGWLVRLSRSRTALPERTRRRSADPRRPYIDWSVQGAGYLLVQDVAQVAAHLNAGNLCLLPSDSAYALTGIPTIPGVTSAIDEILDRQRMPISLAFGSFRMAKRWVQLSSKAEDLIGLLAPGALTFVGSPTGPGEVRFSRDRLYAPTDKIGVRLTQSIVETQISNELDLPLTTAPVRDGAGAVVNDAAPAWERTASRLVAVESDQRVALVRGIVVRPGEVSTVVEEVESGGLLTLRIIRQGAIAREEIDRVAAELQYRGVVGPE